MAKKEKERLRGMRLGMKILGWFHYALGAFQLVMALFVLFAGVRLAGLRVREAGGVLSFLQGWDDTLVGVLSWLFMVGVAVTQLIIGWIWCRKARNTVQQTLAMVLSGLKTLRALFTILAGDILAPKWSNIHALILNGITFTLALWMHLEYRKVREKTKEE